MQKIAIGIISVILLFAGCCKPVADFPGPFVGVNICVQHSGADSLTANDLDTLIKLRKTTVQDDVTKLWNSYYVRDTVLNFLSKINSSCNYLGTNYPFEIQIQWEGNTDTVVLYNSRFKWIFISRKWEKKYSGSCNNESKVISEAININGVDCDMLQDIKTSQGFDIVGRHVYLKH
jgi:hypothetical protein